MASLPSTKTALHQSPLMEWRSFDGYDHQLEHWCWSSQLWSRSLICFISLKERSTVAVYTGSTMAMVSRILMLGKVTHFASLLRNRVASSFNDELFSSKMTNLKPFYSCLVSVLSTSAGVEKTFPSYSISVVSPYNFRSFSNSAEPYLCSCWTSVGHFCGLKML